MTAFTGSPRLLKGALVSVDLFNPISSVVLFQYNPETLTRTLKANAATDMGAKSEAMRLGGAPEETITVEVELDATDQLEIADDNATRMGIYPQLSALEVMIYPKSLQVAINTVLLAVGTVEVVPPLAPFTIFIWGKKRVLPVRITEFRITEEAYDVALNPTRAKVSLGLRVLSYNDLPIQHPGYYVFLSHQIVKETMATIGSLNDISAVAGSDVKLF